MNESTNTKIPSGTIYELDSKHALDSNSSFDIFFETGQIMPEPKSIEQLPKIDIELNEKLKEMYQKAGLELKSYRAPTPIKPYKPSRRNPLWATSDTYQPIKDSYTIDECLNCYDELIKKELSEPICIGGAVGLYLQGIIKRDSFHDLDLVFTKIPELDDDIEDYKGGRGSQYKIKDKKDLPKSVIFEGILIDMFTDNVIQKVSIKYKNKEYICQDYHQILAAKLRMCLQSFKDYDDIIGKHININIS